MARLMGTAKAFQVIGPVRAWEGDQEVDLGPSKQRAVLAALLVNPNRAVSVAQIVDAVWGERPPENGPNVVQKYVAGLRRVLEPDRSARAPGQLIALTEAGYVLTVATDAVDAEVFERRLRAAELAHTDGRATDAADLLHQSLDLWRERPPLAGLTGGFFDAVRDRLVERRADALELSGELALAAGRAGAVVPELMAHVIEYPLRERLRYLLMLALCRAGRQPEALAAYRELRQFLVAEFGVEPGAALQDLHQQILRGDADLAAPMASTPPPVDPWPTADDPVPDTDPDPPAGALSASYGRWPTPISPGGLAQRSAVMVESQVGTPRGYPHPTSPMPAPGAYFPASAYQASSPTGSSRMLTRVAIVAVSCGLAVFSFGLLNWAIVGLLGIRRRSGWAIAAAVVYLVALIGGWTAVAIAPEDALEQPGADLLDLGVGLVMAGWVIGVGHIAILTATDRHWHTPLLGAVPDTSTARDVAGSLEWHRHLLRQQARRIAREQPSVARDLRIGRPDLPRHFDDGGLVDINGVGVDVLGVLPGLSPERAGAIVADRAVRGPFASPYDLVARHLIATETLRYLDETLIVVA